MSHEIGGIHGIEATPRMAKNVLLTIQTTSDTSLGKIEKLSNHIPNANIFLLALVGTGVIVSITLIIEDIFRCKKLNKNISHLAGGVDYDQVNAARETMLGNAGAIKEKV